jgi:class 3 adenylate cyclase
LVLVVGKPCLCVAEGVGAHSMNLSGIEEIERFAPNILLRFLTEKWPRDLPAVEPIGGSLLWIDIVGSTALTNHFAAQGPEGIETLTKLLNGYFSLLTDTVHEHGGDVIAFDGDALLCLWPTLGEDLREASLHAAACAWAARGSLKALQIPEVVHRGGIRVSMYIATGQLDLVVLGGADGRRHFLVKGEALSQIQTASGVAEPDEIAISPATYFLIRDACVSVTMARGWRTLKGLSRRVEVLPIEGCAVPQTQISAVRSFLSPTMNALVGMAPDDRTAEFRRVTLISVRISDKFQSEQDPPNALQDACISIGRAVQAYEGAVEAMCADDKGTIVTIAFGLPFSSHEDDSWRGVSTAIAILNALNVGRTEGLTRREPSSIGVATGSIFCGFLGGKYRSHYALVGDPANLSSRLMQEARGHILCDGITHKEASSGMTFTRGKLVRVKGFAKSIEAFVPVIARDLGSRDARLKTPLFGRYDERKRVTRQLGVVRDTDASRLVWIEGEPGIGKSRLLAFLVDRAQDEGFCVATATGDQIRRSVLYYPWKRIFRELFDEGGDARREEMRAAVLSLLEGNPLLISWAPLLETLLPLGLEENEITIQMLGLARAEATAELVTHILRRINENSPIALVLDDGHWIDSASWGLLSAVARQVPRLLIALASRPVDLPPGYFQELKERPETELLLLGPLHPHDMNDIAAAKLGVRELPKELEQLIFDKAAGNPFFCEEIVFALRDSGAIRIEGPRCHLVKGISEHQMINLPSTVQGMIIGRFDRLDVGQKRALKVGSVIGRTFSVELLADICGQESAKDQLRAHLQDLARLDLALPAEEEQLEAYTFKHAITQEVIYSLMMPEQRQELHRAIAEWYEAHYQDDLTPFLSLLAFHWRRCGSLGRATEYLVRAGQNAISQHANTEAVQFLTEALRLDSQSRQATKDRRGQWEGYLAEAYLKLSDFASCRKHLMESLRLLNHTIPTSSSRLLLRLPWELIRYGSRHFRTTRETSVSEATFSKRCILAHLHQLRAEVAFFDHDFPSLLNATIMCQAEAEGLGPSELLARSCGTTGIVAGIVGLHRLARVHCQRGLDIARKVGDLPTLAYVNQLASVHYSGIGDWALADETICEATEIYRRLGDRYRWQSCLMIRAYLRLYQGDFAGVDELVAVARPVAFPDGIAQVRAWCVAVELLSSLPRGLPEDSLIVEGERAAEDGLDTSEEILVRGALALAHMRRHDFAEARREAEMSADLISRFPPPTYYTMGGVAAVVEVLLSLWKASLAVRGADSSDVSTRAVTAYMHMRKFARRFPFARPRSLLLGGQLAALRRLPQRAARSWHKCIDEATARSMPFEAALAHLMLSRQGESNAKEKERHEDEGRRLLSEIGAQASLMEALVA